MAPRGRFNKHRGGRGGRGRGGGGRGGGGGGNRSYEDNRVSFQDVVKENEKFERYYNSIPLLTSPEERSAFWTALRRELPNSFRITGGKGHALSVRDNLETRFFPLIRHIQHQGQPVDLPKRISWYPEGLAYSMTTPKNIVRKYEPFKEFQKFLVSETGVGNISRQEEVSMIPPLLLDVRPEHTVLDLCAAPGSKSAQLIELIHAGEEERVAKAVKSTKQPPTSEVFNSGRTTGLLIANDVNYKRAQMLVHQVKRLNSPNLIVTNHDATMFPSIELPTSASLPRKGKYLKFDRILADVPCSGDGTTRKNPNIWKEWTPQNGLGLYQTQTRILTRALQMLKVGGRVVYSTCSLNPLENEAVISSAIERCGGMSKVALIDCTDKLPLLQRVPGLTDWSIMARDGRMYESFAESEQYEDELSSKIMPGMFAPDPAEKIPLERCMRVYPHQQDTGGFFITVLEKLGEIRAKAENESKCGKKDWTFVDAGAKVEESEMKTEEPEVVEDAQPSSESQPAQAESSGTKRPPPEDDESPAKRAKVDVPEDPATTPIEAPAQRTRRRDNEIANEESFKYLDPNHPELTSIYNFYQLHHTFPRSRFLVRNPAGDPVKGIYYTSALAKDILIANEGRGMKFVHAGVKMFMKQDVQGQEGVCRWRIQTEGLPIVEGWVGEGRTVRLYKRSTLRKLLVEMFPKVGNAESPEGDGWRALGEIGEQVLKIGMGCCVLRVETSADEDGFTEPIVLPLWRSLHSLNLMLPKEERKAMLLRIFNEDVELVNHSEKSREVAKKEVNGAAKSEVNGEAKKEVDGEVNGEASAENETNGVDDATTLPADDDINDAAMEDAEDGGVSLETAAEA